MVYEMVEKWGRAGFYLSCNCSALVKILLVKEPSHFSMLKSKLWHCKAHQKYEGCKDGSFSAS